VQLLCKSKLPDILVEQTNCYESISAFRFAKIVFIESGISVITVANIVDLCR